MVTVQKPASSHWQAGALSKAWTDASKSLPTAAAAGLESFRSIPATIEHSCD